MHPPPHASENIRFGWICSVLVFFLHYKTRAMGRRDAEANIPPIVTGWATGNHPLWDKAGFPPPRPPGLNEGAYLFLQAKARVAACQLQLILSSVVGGTMSTQHRSWLSFHWRMERKITVSTLLKATAAIFSHCFRRTSVRWRGSFHCHLWLLLYHTCWICLGSLLACSGRFGFLNWVKEKKSLKFHVRQYNCYCQEFCKGQEK